MYKLILSKFLILAMSNFSKSAILRTVFNNALELSLTLLVNPSDKLIYSLSRGV